MKIPVSFVSIPLVALALALSTGMPTTARAQTSSTGSCYTFTRNLGEGRPLDSEEAAALAQDLTSAGFWNVGEQITTYNSAVANAVSGFQERYAARILIPNGLTYGTGYVGVSTRAELNSLYGCSIAVVLPQPSASICPVGYSCMPVTAPDASFYVVPGGIGNPIYVPTTMANSTGNTAVTWPFTFTVYTSSSTSPGNSEPVYISATPSSAVQIGTDLSGVPGVSGAALGTMPVQITTASTLPGDTDIYSGNAATGSFIVPAYSSRTFTVNVTENNLINQNGDGSASVSITGVYYSSKPTPSNSITPTSSESLYSSNLQSLQSPGVSLLGNSGIEFSVQAPTTY